MKSVALHNLGCKVNSYEIEVMQQFLQENGYRIVSFDEVADIYIVNTCTVTNIADRKSRQMLHRAKQKNPEAIVIAVGCYVQTAQDAVEKDDCIDLAIGNNRKKELIPILEAYLAGDRSDKTLGNTTIIDIDHTDEYEEMKLQKTAEHTRAYIKIQDGCNQFCSYCAIPLARGRVRSRKKEELRKEICAMVERGYQEIVLTGIHISSYGIDFERQAYSGQSRLIDLLEEIHQIPGLCRIRLGSLEPRIVTQETARRLADLPKICPHFHLSLQSGCDETLQRMNRRYTAAQFAQSTQALRTAYLERQGVLPAITTDVIVGFPQETEEEFAQTVRFLQDIAFYEMHVFKYSKRKGTRAAVMPGQIPEQVKAQRSTVLLELNERLSKEFRAQHINRRVEVLVEEKKQFAGQTYWVGHTTDYLKVALQDPADQICAGDLVTVRIDRFLTDEVLLGEGK